MGEALKIIKVLKGMGNQRNGGQILGRIEKIIQILRVRVSRK